MKTRLLDLLACPSCGADLDLHAEAWSGEDVETGRLTCSQCSTEYRIERGVPRFVSDDQYVGNFSLEWTVHRQTQLDSSQGRTESREAFADKAALGPEDLKGAVVLDVGCGTGRFAEIAASYGAEVVCIDLSYAVDSAYANLGHLPNVHVVQGSVFDMPFKPGSFDVAYSLGVLHHTPDTHLAFKSMLPFVAPGGTVAIWVYWTQMAGRLSATMREVTTRLPDRVLYKLCQTLVPPIRRWQQFDSLLGKAARRLTISQSEHLDEAILDTFDWYSPKYQWLHDWEEVRGWFEEADFADIQKLSFPVSYKGRLKSCAA